MSIDGYVPNKMLIMNCDYYERPNFVKKRYFLLASLLGCGAFLRNGLQRKIFETNYDVSKHVEGIEEPRLK